MKKAKKIERAIKLIYDSLQSHLAYTYSASAEGKRFHRKCVRDYSELIKLLSELY